MNDVIDTLR